MRLIAAIAIAIGVLSAAAASATRTAVAPPLIGANYTNWGLTGCDRTGTGILASYHERGIRRKVRAQLAAMHAAGLRSLRVLIWHSVEGDQFGMVSSRSGHLDEPYRSNLIRYLTDIRGAGFDSLNVGFAPQGPNDPVGAPENSYDPGLFEQNWSFLREVRPLVKTYGPASTRIDLENEGAPEDGYPYKDRMKAYITEMYRRYVDVFGSHDVSVSIAGDADPADLASAVQNLLDALRASGRELPTWLDVHPRFSYGGALAGLRATDETLTANGVSQPLIIGENAYNDAPVARAIAEFMRTSTRPVLEVMEWPLAASRPCRDFSVPPPYRADAYITVLTGRPAPPPTPDPLPLSAVPTLHASVGPGRAISLTTAAGKPVSMLDSGPYRIVVNDRSALDNFHLTGPDVDRQTGLRFRGTVVWKVDIGGPVPYGSRYSYSSDRAGPKLRRSYRIS